METVKTIEARGKMCPEPIIMLSKEMRARVKGDVVEVVADDLAFEPDLRAWCSATKNELVEVRKEGSIVRAFLRKS
ncbi:MAG: sulfurtransferase TusA family protein [Candidatus Methylomirabilia bacterium]